MLPHQPASTPFPYTTLFRSGKARLFTRNRNTWGNSRPFAACTVINCTASGGASSSRLTTPPDAVQLMTVHARSEEHTSELQSHSDLVCRLLLEKKSYIQGHE